MPGTRLSLTICCRCWLRGAIYQCHPLALLYTSSSTALLLPWLPTQSSPALEIQPQKRALILAFLLHAYCNDPNYCDSVQGRRKSRHFVVVLIKRDP